MIAKSILRSVSSPGAWVVPLVSMAYFVTEQSWALPAAMIFWEASMIIWQILDDLHTKRTTKSARQVSPAGVNGAKYADGNLQPRRSSLTDDE